MKNQCSNSTNKYDAASTEFLVRRASKRDSNEKRSALSDKCWIVFFGISLLTICDQAISQDESPEGSELGAEVVRLNRQADSHPECKNTRTITKDEIVEAIKILSKPSNVSDEEFELITQIAVTENLPNHIKLRQFVRYHTGSSMLHGRWIRLILQHKNHGPYSFQIRNEVTFERPLTQRERWAQDEVDHSGGVMLLNRFVSWFPEDAAFNKFETQSISYDPLVDAMRNAVNSKDVDRVLSLVHREGVGKEERLLLRREMEGVLERGVRKLEIKPKLFSGHLNQMQAFKSFDSNLHVEAYLKSTLVAGGKNNEPDDRQSLWLELGNAGGEPRIACYVVSSDRKDQFVGKRLSGTLKTSGGFNILLDEKWIESGFEIQAPDELDHLNQANLELWKRPI